MNINEKVGQLSQFGDPFMAALKAMKTITRKAKWPVFGRTGANKTNMYRKSDERDPHNIPAIFAYDVIHG